jgi:anti-sigma regulatory factor (Ser/Thr protein kinase)
MSKGGPRLVSSLGNTLHTRHVEFDGSSATHVRLALRDYLQEQHASVASIADATHVVYELVMNGIEHGVPDRDHALEVSWGVEGEQLRISVLDRGTPDDGHVVALRTPTSGLPGGRGLAMVDAFSDSWTVDRSDGTRVTAFVALVR